MRIKLLAFISIVSLGVGLAGLYAEEKEAKSRGMFRLQWLERNRRTLSGGYFFRERERCHAGEKVTKSRAHAGTVRMGVSASIKKIISYIYILNPVVWKIKSVKIAK